MAFRTTQRSRPSYGQGYARSADEAANPGLWRALAGLWLPELGATGGSIFDAGGSRNHGTLTNMAIGADWVTGPLGGALNFDADSIQHVDIPLSVSGPDVTVVFWAKFNAALGSPNKHAVDLNLGEARVVARFNPNNWFVRDGAGQSMSPTLGAIDGVWSQYALVVDDTVAVSFLDGVELGTASNGALSLGSLTNMKLGANAAAAGEAFGGLLANVHLWARALSPAEIKHLFVDPHAIVRRRITIPLADQAAPTTNIDTQQKRMSVVGVGRPWLRSAFPGAKNQAWRQARGSIYAGNPVAAPPAVGGGRNIVLGGGVF